MQTTIRIGIADMNYCDAPNLITTLGLGSCVGVVLYDSAIKKCGMVHIMLPDSTIIQNNSNVAKFADTGIQALYDGFINRGASKARIQAKIAGGAQMFAFGSSNSMMRVGENNIRAVKEKLQQLRIPLVAEDTGLNHGRTIVFDPETSLLKVKIVGMNEKVI
ncbi:MAG: chemotaxis protein CheD [Lachnospiraceae bacterium]|nr:chemotaxis protein CheD [Lachnospiraceae bacterium]